MGLVNGECAVVLGQLLREARLRAGMSQEELATRTRLTREYVSLLELGKRTPTVYVFIRLAKAVGQVPAELLAQIENEKEGRLVKGMPSPKRSK